LLLVDKLDHQVPDRRVSLLELTPGAPEVRGGRLDLAHPDHVNTYPELNATGDLEGKFKVLTNREQLPGRDLDTPRARVHEPDLKRRPSGLIQSTCARRVARSRCTPFAPSFMRRAVVVGAHVSVV
jgi:hypothetical protein